VAIVFQCRLFPVNAVATSAAAAAAAAATTNQILKQETCNLPGTFQVLFTW